MNLGGGVGAKERAFVAEKYGYILCAREREKLHICL